MKKICTTILAAILAVTMTACASSESIDKMIKENMGLNDSQTHLLQKALKDNGVHGSIKSIEQQGEGSYSVKCGTHLYTVIITADGLVNQILSEDNEQIYLNIESLPAPEANTQEAINYMYAKAKEEAKSMTGEQARVGYDYIVDAGSKAIGNLIRDNETMEKCIYYGAILELKYAKDNEKISTFGYDIVNLVQGIYTGTESTKDKSFQDKVNKVGVSWADASKQQWK